MGNQAVQKQIISQVLEESEQVTCLNKTESPWHETILRTTKEEGPLVVKQLLKIKNTSKFADLHLKMNKLHKLINSERYHPNVMDYYKQSPVMIQQGDKDVTLLLRQFVCHNLSEKLIHIPQLLTMIEKKWLIFQLMCALEQLHSIPGLTHGDIKPDNILVTSYDWLYLADIHPYKPVVVMDDNLKRYNKYFGYLDNNIRCYLAPERWLTAPQTLADSGVKMAPSMDIFSAGCVIAEILNDGEPLFDLPRLQSYRRGGLDLREELNKRVEDDTTVNLLLKMLSKDPTDRPSAQQCLAEWSRKVFPDSFNGIFFQMGSAFQRLSYLYSDNRIALIKFHINEIFEKCFGVKDAIVSQKFFEPMEPTMHRLCTDDQTIQRFQELVPTGFKFMQAPQWDENIEQSEDDQNEQSAEQKTKDLRDSALIIVHWIGQLYPSCFYPQMRIVALEMLQKISIYLPFETRLGQVLPYVARIFDTIQQESSKGDQQQQNWSSRVRVKALEVLLALFGDLIDRTDMIIIEPFDFKVFQNYILPIVKKLMDQSRGDPLIRHALARNLAQLARVGTRLIEVAQGSAIRLRQEIRDKREHMRNHGIRDSVSVSVLDSFKQGQAPWMMDAGKNVQHSFLMMQRRTIVSNRVASTAEGLLAHSQFGQNNAPQQQQTQQDVILEDIVVPNFDQELESLWLEVERFIQSFTGEDHDSNALISMLANLTELSQIFGAEKSDFLMMQCISGINRSDYQVKIQVLKTLSSLCLRIGQQKVAANIMPLTESVLQDPEDLVVIQTIKMLVQFVKLRLMNKQQCTKTLENILPLLLHPNQQIRIQVGTYISILANPPALDSAKQEESKQQETSRRIVINRTPLFTQEEFYCFIRPKLLIYAKDQSDEMLDIHSAKELLAKLRKPLSLSTMRSYFKELSKENQGDLASQNEENFQKTQDMSDSDTFAFAFLSEYFKERLRKLQNYKRQQQVILSMQTKKQQSASGQGTDQFQLQKRVRTGGKVYRCLKASAIAYLTKIELLDNIKRVNREQISGKEGPGVATLTKDQKAAFVREYQENVTQLFDPQTQVIQDRYHQANYGLNNDIEEESKSDRESHKFITPETQKILKALNEVPLVKQSDTLGYLQQSRYGQTGVTQGFRINTEIALAPQKAQPSLIAHFDTSDRESFRMTDDLQKEFKISKMSGVPNLRPQGLLVTTLYEHRNPVNTVSVTDDQKFFLTGSREDKTVHLWSIQNIEEDVTSRSTHSFSTGSSYINQVSMINRTKSMAVAGSGGIQIHDLERSSQSQSSQGERSSPRSSRRREDHYTKIDLQESHDEVTRCLNLLTPNSNGSHLLCAATQKGAFFMHDLRAKNHVLYQKDSFGCQRGAVTSMCIGSDPYQLTMGTLGGYVMVYDIRYNVVSSMFSHNMHYPILAMATYKKGDNRDAPLALVSAGGPMHELSSLNLESGLVETLFRCTSPTTDNKLSKTDCPVIPEFTRETNFKDNKFSTVRRETTLKQFSSQLHSVRNHEVFTDIQSAIQSKLIKNIDSQLVDVSTRQRFKLLHDACKSTNACRSILVPRNAMQRIMVDNSTAQYAITGGNDMKLRYWNLNDTSKLSFQINTPRDDEVTYMSERIRETTVVQERLLSQKELPSMTSQKISDSSSAAQAGYYQRTSASSFVKFAENTAYHNSIASGWNKQVVADSTARLTSASSETQQLMQRFQYEKGEGNHINVQTMNGVSPGQSMNNLGILTNGQQDSQHGSQQTQGATMMAGQNMQGDSVTEQTTRNSEIVSHADTILDLALVDYKHHDQYAMPLLISCSRDSTVKVWRC